MMFNVIDNDSVERQLDNVEKWQKKSRGDSLANNWVVRQLKSRKCIVVEVVSIDESLTVISSKSTSELRVENVDSYQYLKCVDQGTSRNGY